MSTESPRKVEYTYEEDQRDALKFYLGIAAEITFCALVFIAWVILA